MEVMVAKSIRKFCQASIKEAAVTKKKSLRAQTLSIPKTFDETDKQKIMVVMKFGRNFGAFPTARFAKWFQHLSIICAELVIRLALAER